MAQGVFRNLLGQRFGRLLVVARSHNTKQNKPQWLCLCYCNAFTVVASSDLLRSKGGTISCGCWRRENRGKTTRTHGMTQTREYAVWHAMMGRCHSPTHQAYSSYGGRGIFVCDAWKDFANFYRDMGPRPSNKYSIERLNNDLGYSKDNVVWATHKEQMSNTRMNRHITFNGKTMILEDWASELGIEQSTLWARLYRYKWSLECAFTTPVRPSRKRSPHGRL